MYSGLPPESADFAITGTLLAVLDKSPGGTIGVPATESIIPPGSSVFPFDGGWSGIPVATGTIGWFRIRDTDTDGDSASTTHERIDGTVSDTSGDIILSSVDTIAGQGIIHVEQILLAIDQSETLESMGSGIFV